MTLNLFDQLTRIRPELSKVAQSILNEWEQDEFDELGGGGVCDLISSALSEVIYNKIPDVEIQDGGHEGDDHSWLIVFNETEAVGVDIPSSLYETGGGYSWTKIQNAVISPSDVSLWEINRKDLDPIYFRQASKKPDKDDLRLQVGPAFFLKPDGTWTVQSVSPSVAEKARFSGFLTIEGYKCVVFELNGKQWAQKLGKPVVSSVVDRVASRWMEVTIHK
jgi:hypothetical protein